MIPPRLVLGPLDALESALAAEVRAWKDRDPLDLPVVLVATTLLGRYLRRRLGYAAGGHVGLRCLTFHELALLTGRDTPAMAGRQPLPRFGRRALAEEVAVAAPGDLAAVGHTPGFAVALERLFRELLHAGVGPAALRGALPGTPRNRALADLYEAFEGLRAPFFAPDDCLPAADPGRFDAPALLVYGVWSLTVLQRAFLSRLAERVPLVFYLPTTGTEADDAHAELRAWLASLGAREETLAAQETVPTGLAHLKARLFAPPAPGPLDGTVLLLSAPDPAREVREAARACLRWAAEGIPFHEMAVVYRQEDPYRALVDEALAEAGIPAFLASGRPLADLPPGRGIRLLLDLVGSPLRRAAVMEFLTEVPLPPATAERYGGAEPAAWDAVSREAGVVEGLEQWTARLRLLQAVKREESQDGETSHRLQADLDRIEALLRFIQDLAGRLAAHPPVASWGEHLTSLRRLAAEYVDGAEPALTALAALEGLAPLVGQVSLERFRRTAALVLEQTDGSPLLEESRRGSFGRRGVNVLPLSALTHLRFRAVAILGLTERDFPPPPRQDPLLLDADRLELNRRLGWSLPLRALGPDEEPLRFALAVQAAGERLLLSYHRADSGTGRQRLPSHFFRAAAEALAGPLERLEALDRLDPRLYVRVPAGRFGAGTPAAALTEDEYARTLLTTDRALGEAWLAARAPAFGRARAAWFARWLEPSLTPYDGVLAGPAASLARRAGLASPISPTRLETYATCPFRFFLAHVLRLEPVEEPELLERLEPVERGSLVHKVLERFMTEHRDDPPRPERRAAHLDRLLAIAHEECRAREEQGLTGYPLLWELDRRAIFEDLEAWYDLEAAEAGGLLRPTAFELRFGPAWGEPGDPRSVDEPLTLSLAGLTLQFQGRIDRVDVSPDGSAFRVTDYKTGRVGDDHKDGALSGGRALQLPIYLLAAAHALGVPWERGEAQYYYVTRTGGFRRVRFSGETLRARWDEFTAVLQGLARGIAAGDFHPFPGPQGRHCQRCDYRTVCDSRVRQLAERKAADPRAAAFLALTEVE